MDLLTLNEDKIKILSDKEIRDLIKRIEQEIILTEIKILKDQSLTPIKQTSSTCSNSPFHALKVLLKFLFAL